MSETWTLFVCVFFRIEIQFIITVRGILLDQPDEKRSPAHTKNEHNIFGSFSSIVHHCQPFFHCFKKWESENTKRRLYRNIWINVQKTVMTMTSLHM